MIEEELFEHLKHLGSMEKIKYHNMLLDFFLQYPRKQKITDLNIIILNAPNNGFGDLVFATKLDKYIQTWYPSCRVQIASTSVERLRSLGYDNAIELDCGNGSTQCRDFDELQLRTREKFDLILIAPLSIGFDPDLSKIKTLIPYATYWNTYWFSEYNDNTRKKFSIHTGIGQGRDGLFLINSKSAPNPNYKYPFAMAYVASNIPGVEQCLLAFINMICAKYIYKKFILLVPPWFGLDIISARHLSEIPNYGKIFMIDRNKKISVIKARGDESSTFLILCNVFPVENSKMISLMKYSVRDILLTGDQSISDCLSCCPTKNIFYQIVGWKVDFARELTRLLPNEYLGSVRTSCGTLDAISYESDYRNFVREYDFKKLGKPKLTAIMRAASAYRDSTAIRLFYEVIWMTRTVETLYAMIERYFQYFVVE